MNRSLRRNLHRAVILCLLGLTGVGSETCHSTYAPMMFGNCIDAHDCPGAALPQNCNSGPNTVCCIQESTTPPGTNNPALSREIFYQIVGETSRIQALYPFFNQALKDAGISAKKEIAVFTAQVIFTTKNLTISEEHSNGSQYEGDGSLGNTLAGDGGRFRSRGFLPMVGRSMYDRVGKALGEKLLDDPEKAAMPSTGFKIASWLWKNGYSSASIGGLGKYCDETIYNFIQLSHEIHNIADDIENLLSYWRNALRVLGLPCPSVGNGPSCTIDGKNGTCMLENACKSRYRTDSSCSESPLIKCCRNCENPADLALLVDSSSSVGLNNFQLGLKYMAGLFEIAPEGTRVALIRFSKRAQVLLHFNSYTNESDIRASILAVPYIQGGTSTHLALKLAHQELFGTEKSGVRPKSDGISRVLVLLTDGRAGKGIESVKGPSEVLRADGVSIFVVGIGSNVNLIELNVIASDPDEHHVFRARSYDSVSRDVKLMHEYYCNEPAALESNTTISSSVEHHLLKYYKYEPQTSSGLRRIRLKPVEGETRLFVSLKDRNPRHRSFLTDFCGDTDKNKHSFSSSVPLESMEENGTRICTEHPNGVVSKPVRLTDGSFVVYVLMCSSQRIYVSVEGMDDPNRFNLTITQGNLDLPDPNNTRQEGNSSYTFAIRREVYASAGVALTTSAATVAAYVTLSCAGKSFEVKSSSKLKKKKKKSKDRENNNDSEKGGANTTDTNNGKESTKKTNGSLPITVEKGTSDRSASSTNGNKKNESKGRKKATTPKLYRGGSTISSMIGALSRKDSQSPITETSNVEQAKKGASGSVKRKEVRSASVTVEVQESGAVNSNNKSTGIGRSAQPQVKTSVSHSPAAGTLHSGRTLHKQNGGTEQRELLSNDSSFSLLTTSPNQSGGKPSCCVVCLPCFSSDKSGKSPEQATDPNGDKKQGDQDKKTKRSLKERIRASLTKRNIMACFLPCVTYYILDDGKHESGSTGEEVQEKREKRLERDMKISQAFCIMLSQVVFFVGADNTGNKVQCAAVAIIMNYLYLVALGWLVSQSFYIFSFIKTNQSVKSRSKTVKYYYICAWGLPLIVVCIMLGNTDTISDNAHCWISFMDSVSWAVSTPILTMSLVQVIIIILLIKAIVTFKKTNDKEHDAMRLGIIKSGLLTVGCLSLTVLLTWLMGTISLNIDKKVYSDAYAVLNAGQGILLFFFFVVLSPEVRLLLTSAWLLFQKVKTSAVTPFDEHEGLEIEEDEEKKKKKKSNAAKAVETGGNIAMASSALSTASSNTATAKNDVHRDMTTGSAQPKGADTARKKNTPGKQESKQTPTTPASKSSQPNATKGQEAKWAAHKGARKAPANNTNHYQKKVSYPNLVSAKNEGASSKAKPAQSSSPVKSTKSIVPQAASRAPSIRKLEPPTKARPKSPNVRRQQKRL